MKSREKIHDAANSARISHVNYKNEQFRSAPSGRQIFDRLGLREVAKKTPAEGGELSRIDETAYRTDPSLMHLQFSERQKTRNYNFEPDRKSVV